MAGSISPLRWRARFDPPQGQNPILCDNRSELQTETPMFDASNLTAADVMTAEVATVRPEATLRQAARVMAERRVSGLPVVNGAGAVVGLLTEADLVRPDEAAERRRDWWLTMLA